MNTSKKIVKSICLFLFCMLLVGCGTKNVPSPNDTNVTVEETTSSTNLDETITDNEENAEENERYAIDEYSGNPICFVNDNIPYFTLSEIEDGKTSFEQYSELDGLSRPQVAYASLSSDTMPPKGSQRGEIGQVKPAGWETKKYDCINGNYVYNRCHLIAWCLGNENANERNLVTGTRYMNVDGMLPYEEMVAKYLEQHPNNHVLYRVIPKYTGDNLVCDGVFMEALSVEDKGQGVRFCIYCYNVQPGIDIDYETGKTSYSGHFLDTISSSVNYNLTTNDPDGIVDPDMQVSSETGNKTSEYVLNTNTNKFHKSSCESVQKMSEKNKKVCHNTKEEMIAQGYEPCKSCNP